MDPAWAFPNLSLRDPDPLRLIPYHVELASVLFPSPQPSPRGEGITRRSVGQTRCVGSNPKRKTMLPLLGERVGVRGKGVSNPTNGFVSFPSCQERV
jgi:hypothetical protein